ncbi:MAG: T9SS type A sorting domain-containing protein, partial [Candidatus Kapaibacterium sp.]
CDGGIFRTDDATNAAPTWVPLNNNYLTSQFYTVALDPGTPGSRTLLAGAQDNGTWTTFTDNAAEPWRTPFGGDGGFCAIVPGGNIMLVSPQNGPIYMLTINSDSTPGEYVRIDPPIEDQVLFVNPFALDPANPNILYDAGGHTIWQCLNITGIDNPSQDPTDLNWTELTETGTDSTITALGVSRSNPGNRLYYGTSDGRVYRLDEAISAHNPPRDITSGAFPDGAYINCIAVDPEDGNSAIVVFTNYNVKSLFLTIDAGEHWTPIGGNLEQFEDGTGNGPSCRWATMVHRRNGTVYFVATTTGLYSTTRLAGNSTAWSLEGASTIGNVRVDMIQARESDGTVAVATWGHGIFTTQLPDMVAGVAAPARTALRLEQNFPNPFSTTTEIRFEIPEDGMRDAALEVIDPLGRIVVVPFTGGTQSGEGSIRLDLSAIPPSRMPSGVYTCRLRCGERSMTRRMVVMR